MNKIKQATNVLALCTIVGLCVWVSLLAGQKRDAEYKLWKYKQYTDSIFKGNEIVHKLYSITISQMPPVEYLDFLKRQGK